MIRLFFCAAALAAPMAAAQQPAVTIAPAVDGNVLRAGAKVPVARWSNSPPRRRR
nr:hypothetical protein [Sphingobium yanoikuyae]